MIELRTLTCPLCEATCGLEVELRQGMIEKLRGDALDPFSRGHVCPKAAALPDLHSDPDRLRQPMLRGPSGWQEVSWDRALNEAAAGLRRVQAQGGRDAVALYLGNPMVHNYEALLHVHLLSRALGTRQRYSATSVDQLPHQLAAFQMFGHQLLLPVPDLDRIDFLLMLGANPAVSNGSMMTAPDVARRLRHIVQRGGTVVLVDPRRSETARLVSRHLFLHPGQDVYLLLGLLHTLLAEGLTRPSRLRPLARGWDLLDQVVAGFSAHEVSSLTGLQAEEIRALARQLAGAPRAAVYGRVGLSTQEFGGLCQWLIQLLNAVTGNLDREGGAMFATPAVDVRRLTHPGSFSRRRSRVRGLPAFGGEFPVATLAEEILTAGPGQISGLVCVAGNPVLSTPNGSQLERALAGLDFMLAIDPYLNETTRHARVILPPPSPLQRGHYDLVFNGLAIRNGAKFSPPLYARAGPAEWQIYIELAHRLGGLPGWARALALRLGPEFWLDLGLRCGPYGSGLRFWRDGLSLKKLRQHPHGLDLGPLQPGRLERIELVPEIYRQDLERARRRANQPRPSLVLIGRRQLRSNNSWMHNSHRLVKGKPVCTLQMNPEDAAQRGLTPGDRARVRTRVGQVEVAVELSQDLMPGVVSLPHGWGHHRPGTRQQTAASQPGVSLNDLTDHEAVDELTGNAAFSGLAVEVERAD
jgi:anaerobic selenocysteine-containing dehydrogenase